MEHQITNLLISADILKQKTNEALEQNFIFLKELIRKNKIFGRIFVFVLLNSALLLRR